MNHQGPGIRSIFDGSLKRYNNGGKILASKSKVQSSVPGYSLEQKEIITTAQYIPFEQRNQFNVFNGTNNAKTETQVPAIQYFEHTPVISQYVVSESNNEEMSEIDNLKHTELGISYTLRRTYASVTTTVPYYMCEYTMCYFKTLALQCKKIKANNQADIFVVTVVNKNEINTFELNAKLPDIFDRIFRVFVDLNKNAIP